MSCIKCKSERIARVSGKTSDMCYWEGDGIENDGYVPGGVGIGGGDYINFTYCMDCGQMQGDFPVGAKSLLEEKIEDLEVDIADFKERLQEPTLPRDIRTLWEGRLQRDQEELAETQEKLRAVQ